MFLFCDFILCKLSFNKICYKLADHYRLKNKSFFIIIYFKIPSQNNMLTESKNTMKTELHRACIKYTYGGFFPSVAHWHLSTFLFFFQMAKSEDLDNDIDEMLHQYESKCQRQLLHCVLFYWRSYATWLIATITEAQGEGLLQFSVWSILYFYNCVGFIFVWNSIIVFIKSLWSNKENLESTGFVMKKFGFLCRLHEL